MTLGELLFISRKQLNLTQREVAIKTSTCKSHISEYENNRLVPKGKTLDRLKETLNLSDEQIRAATNGVKNDSRTKEKV